MVYTQRSQRLVKGWRGRGGRKIDGERERGRTGGFGIAGERSWRIDATPMSRVLVTPASERLSVFDYCREHYSAQIKLKSTALTGLRQDACLLEGPRRAPSCALAPLLWAPVTREQYCKLLQHSRSDRHQQYNREKGGFYRKYRDAT